MLAYRNEIVNKISFTLFLDEGGEMVQKFLIITHRKTNSLIAGTIIHIQILSKYHCSFGKGYMIYHSVGFTFGFRTQNMVYICQNFSRIMQIKKGRAY